MRLKAQRLQWSQKFPLDNAYPWYKAWKKKWRLKHQGWLRIEAWKSLFLLLNSWLFFYCKAIYLLKTNIEIFGRCEAHEKKIVQKKKLFYFCTLEKNIVLRWNQKYTQKITV